MVRDLYKCCIVNSIQFKSAISNKVPMGVKEFLQIGGSATCTLDFHWVVERVAFGLPGSTECSVHLVDSDHLYTLVSVDTLGIAGKGSRFILL